jgi:hypothetical protein
MKTEPVRYQEFLKFVFDRPEPTSNEDVWYWSEPEDYQASDAEWVALYTHLFTHCGKDLLPFSNIQVGVGLYYLLSTFQNSILNAQEAFVAEASEAQLVQGIGVLYRDCFNPRCNPAALEDSQRYQPLEYICLMLWEVLPILNSREGVAATLDVLEASIRLSNPVCKHSAVYGLRDARLAASSDPAQVERIDRIVDGLAQDPTLDGGLRLFLEVLQEERAFDEVLRPLQQLFQRPEG